MLQQWQYLNNASDSSLRLDYVRVISTPIIIIINIQRRVAREANQSMMAVATHDHNKIGLKDISCYKKRKSAQVHYINRQIKSTRQQQSHGKKENESLRQHI